MNEQTNVPPLTNNLEKQSASVSGIQNNRIIIGIPRGILEESATISLTNFRHEDLKKTKIDEISTLAFSFMQEKTLRTHKSQYVLTIYIERFILP